MAGTLTDTHGALIDHGKVSEFGDGLDGQAIAPDDSLYDSARRIWNASVDKNPGLIARCASSADVVKAINFARTNQIQVAVRGGGHNVGGRALCDDGLVIDMSQMRKIDVDTEARTVVAQAGCRLGDLDAATHPHGLVVPAGVVKGTGIAGLTLGGGVGWLVRKYGLTCDNVLSFEVVTADGDIVMASADENEDLFWGLRGGGGNFGVVVTFTYRAHPLTTVLGGLLIHPRAKAGEVLRFYRDFMETAPDELTAYAAMLHSPDGDPIVAIIPCWCGDLDAGEKYLRPMREFGPPLVDAVQPIPFPQMQALFDDAFPDGNHNYWKSAFVNELSDEAIDLLVEHANAVPSPLSVLIVELYGGAMARVGADETAFAHRTSDHVVGILSQWADPADTETNIAWTRGVYDALQPHASGAFLLNFLDQEDDAVIRAAFGSNYNWLAELKRKYDPANFFRNNQNIEPAR